MDIPIFLIQKEYFPKDLNDMDIKIHLNPEALGMAAGREAAEKIREAISNKGHAHIILATGTSQFNTLQQLLAEEEIDWNRVTMFHLDEYIGLPATHAASFRRYLKERFIEKVPTLHAAHLINAENNPDMECLRLADLIRSITIDIALIGIGENGHLAFNDPPADFKTEDPYIIVDLDEACRKQQLGEGWFDRLEDVPKQAISMSVTQIMKSKHIVCSVPDERKALAVANCLNQEVSNFYPASILQNHASCSLFLDKASASLLNQLT
jgi:glucosamine-6-phosphate deaminase